MPLCAVSLAKAEEVGSVGPGARKVTIGVDSGAGVTIWPKNLCSDYPTKKTAKTGERYAPAGKNTKAIVNEGERLLKVVLPDSEERALRTQVGDVRKPLVAVSEMSDAGHDVHF